MIRDFIYDIETYKNVFTLATISEDRKIKRVYEISDRKNDADVIFKYLDFLHNNNLRMVGFNNKGFDYPVIHWLLDQRENYDLLTDGKKLAHKLFRKAQQVIDIARETGFPPTVRNEYVQQIDLYKIHHFDNPARSTSLKMLEFNMRSDNIQDLPYEIGSNLDHDQIDNLIVYNEHDVDQTLEFYFHTLKSIRFREELTEKYEYDFLNHSDAKIGKDYFILKLEEEGHKCFYMDGRKRKPIQTKRKSIPLKDCLFDYYDFERPEFIAVKEWFEKQDIKETKGVFTEILESDLGEVAKYAELLTKRKKLPEEPSSDELARLKSEYPSGWHEPVVLKSGKISHYWKWNIATCLNVVVDGLRIDFGTGGIHASLSNKIVRSTSERTVRDADVSSYYPNLAISNNIYPAHMGEQFCDIYVDVYNQRKQFDKSQPENGMMKLALNAVYGDSNNKFSPFYDPMYTMSITINGQLSLCLLAEKLLGIPSVSVVQMNTDGLTIACDNEYLAQTDDVFTKWQEQVKLELEFVDYDAMYIRDVNNYIAVKKEGGIKRKGAYEYDGLGWHQNHSALVIKKAAEAEMVYGKSAAKFIKNHADIMDFMLRTKVPRSSRLVLEYEDGRREPEQNICRYYPSKNGGKLIKIMPPLPKDPTKEREIGIESKYKVKTCNKMVDFDGDIDYDYYITEAKKLIIE